MENVCETIIRLSESNRVYDWERCAGLQLIMGLVYNPLNNIVKRGLIWSVFNKKLSTWAKSLCEEEEMDEQHKLILELLQKSEEQELVNLAPKTTTLGVIQHLINTTHSKM
jgi:hypothetical protein